MTEENNISVSAIVISYFTGPLLARCVASLAAQPDITEIILVDNGNFPGDVDEATSLVEGSATINVLSGHGNIGFAAACNKGATAANGTHLLFFNPDAIMPTGGTEQLLADSQTLKRPWMMGAMLVGPDGIEQQGSRRATLTPWRAFVEATQLYRLAPQHPYFRRFNLHANPAPEKVVDVPVISGACIFIPHADYDLIDGMDESYFLHVEDVDFCLRFAKAGGDIYFNPHFAVTHFKSSSRANPVKIEARKTAGIIRYFNTHFSQSYPKPFLWLVAGALWAVFGVLFVKRAIIKALKLFGFRARTGAEGMRRARAISARRDER